MSKIEKTKALISIYFNEIWNKGRMDLLDEIIAPDYINHSPGTPDPKPGPEGLKPIILDMRNGFPDLNYEIKDLIITEDKIVAKTVVSGTHVNDIWGMKPTGKKFEVDQINIEYIKDDKISEHWRITNELKMMKDLGVIN